MERFFLLAPALVLLVTTSTALIVYTWLKLTKRTHDVSGVKHNQLFGPFFGQFVIWYLRPLERLLVGRVSPNAITMASLVACGLAGVAASQGHLGATAWLYATGGILDLLDGRIARLSGRQTKAGALFDSVADRWAELMLFAGFAWLLRDTAWLLAVLAASAGSMMVSYTRARGEALGVDLSGGMMQRAERIVLVSGGSLLAAWYGTNPERADLVAPVLGGTLLLCAITASATAISRWVQAYRELARREAPGAAVTPAPAAPDEDRAVVEPRAYPVIPAKLRESAELTR